MSHKKHKIVFLSFGCLLCLFVATFAWSGALAIMVLEALLIAGLLFQRANGARASRRLGESEERFAQAKNAEQQLAELTGRLLRTQDDERRHIARELHDGTAQSIGLIMLNLAQVQGTAGKLDRKNADRLSESLALSEQALREIRTLSYILHPPLLDQAGLVTALKWYLKGFIDRSGVKVAFSETGSNSRMAPEVEYALFRVVQECLTNIRRHTNSETAEIGLTRTSKQIVLTVKDHGKGHQLAALPNGDGIESIGVGIPGMRHRLKQLGGELLVDTDGNGTTVTATVPF